MAQRFDVGEIGNPEHLVFNNHGQIAGRTPVVRRSKSRRAGGFFDRYNLFFWDPGEATPRQRNFYPGGERFVGAAIVEVTDGSPAWVRISEYPGGRSLYVHAWDGRDRRVRLNAGFPWVKLAGMNSRGAAAGEFCTFAGGSERLGRIDADTEALTLLEPAGTFGSVYGINEADEVLGNVREDLVLWDAAGVRHETGVQGITSAKLTRRSPTLVVAARSPVAGAPTLLAWRPGGSGGELVLPWDGTLFVSELNDRGVALLSFVDRARAVRALLWEDRNGSGAPELEELVDLTPPGAQMSLGWDLNGATPASVVVEGIGPGRRRKRWLWREGTWLDPGGLFPKGSREGTVVQVNDRNQLLGGARVKGRWHGYLIEPAP